MLYFQDDIKAAPIATNCVRENGDTCDSFSDTDNRYLATETGDYLDMLPGAINFHRSGLKVNLNDESGITLSSSGNLSVSGGSVSISGGSVSINASSKIKVQKGKSGYISLENEFYSEASATCECGSDRQSYGAFTDDEPTAGVKEALAKLREKGIIEENINGNLTFAMAGAQPALGLPATLDDFLANRAAILKVPEAELVPTSKDSVPLEGEELKNRDDIEVFDSKKSYTGEYVKTQAGDDEFILGKAYPNGSESVFVPCDPSAAIEHAGTFENHLKTFKNAAMNTAYEMYYDLQKAEDYASYVGSALKSDRNGMLNAMSDISSVNEERERTNKFYRDKAPYKAAYDADNSIINLAMTVDGIKGMASIPGKISNLGKIIKIDGFGIKIMNGAKLSCEAAKGLEISVDGVGTVTAIGKNALETGFGISNIMESSSDSNTNGGSGGNGETSPRYGDRQISDEEYEMLRKHTPTQEIRDKVNEGHDKNVKTNDEVLPGKTFKGSLEADHIVSMDKISKMDGFGKLTKEQQLEVLNNPDNFIGLSKSANTSKGAKSYEEWTHYKKGKIGEIEVEPEFRNRMMKKEMEIERKLQKQIDDFVKDNEINNK